MPAIYRSGFLYTFWIWNIAIAQQSSVIQLYQFENYLVNVANLFFAVIIAMIARQLYALAIIFFVLAVMLFFRRYYRFEPQQNPDL